MDFDYTETSERLTQASARELGIVLEALFENPVWIGTGVAEAPIIGMPYFVGMHSELLPTIFRAVRVKERFHRKKPAWAPDLPLRQEDIEVMVAADDPRCNVVGLYANSLRAECWDLRHPRFDLFCRGLMACEYAPREIRSDPDLQQLFPPRRLEGLCDGKLNWRSPEVLAMDQRVEEIVAEYEARTGVRRATPTAPARWNV